MRHPGKVVGASRGGADPAAEQGLSAECGVPCVAQEGSVQGAGAGLEAYAGAQFAEA